MRPQEDFINTIKQTPASGKFYDKLGIHLIVKERDNFSS